MPRERDPCAAFDEDLSALIDAELAPARRAELESHLEGCARCRARLVSLRRVDELLAATPLPDVSERLREAVTRQGARATPGAERAPARAGSRWLGAPALAAIAAAAVLSLYLALRPRPESGPPAAPEPPVAVEPRPPAELPAHDEPPPTLIAEPLPPPQLEVPEFVPELSLPEPPLEPLRDPLLAETDLEAEPPEDLAVVLFGAVEPDDLDVIANLEILERLIALEPGRG